MERSVDVDDAIDQLPALVHETAEHDVALIHHDRRLAVLVGAERYDALVERCENALDRLSVHETAHEAVVALDELPR